jgi:hypothetical protein
VIHFRLGPADAKQQLCRPTLAPMLFLFSAGHRFKEAFSPELIEQAVQESPVPVRRLADPFGGSGTSALTCQFLGVRPVTIEVNPFLADLIAAKLGTYHVPELLSALTRVSRKRYRVAFARLGR